MCEGQILLGILSFVLYCKEFFLYGLAAMSGELGYHAARSLAGNSPDTEDAEEVEPAHAGVTAQGGLLVSRKHK